MCAWVTGTKSSRAEIVSDLDLMLDRPLRRLAALARPQRFFFGRELHREPMVPVAKCQLPTYGVRQTVSLFDHLVGTGEHGRWHVKAERLGGLQVDCQNVCGWRLHR